MRLLCNGATNPISQDERWGFCKAAFAQKNSSQQKIMVKYSIYTIRTIYVKSGLQN
jgi:hypothetical protein